MRKPLEDLLLKAYFRQRVTDFQNNLLRRRRRGPIVLRVRPPQMVYETYAK